MDDFMAVVALAIELHFLANGIDSRAVLPDTEFVKGAEFIRQVRKLGISRDVETCWIS